MLKISQNQYSQLEDRTLQTFLQEMVAHVGEKNPRLRPTLTDEEVEILVRAALSEAGEQEFTFRGPMRLWIDLRLAFGSGVLRDPLHAPWVTEALSSVETTAQMQRAEALYEAILKTQRTIHGSEGSLTKAALVRLLKWARSDPQPRAEDWPQSAMDTMTTLHPEKAKWCGEAALAALADRAAEAAEQHKSEIPRTRTLFAALMFAFGAGCLDDPNYPWIARTLLDERIPDPAKRVVRLERKAIVWLAHVVEGGNPSDLTEFSVKEERDE